MNNEKLILENQQAIMNILLTMRTPHSEKSTVLLLSQILETAKALNPKEDVPYDKSLKLKCYRCGKERKGKGAFCNECKERGS